MTIRSYNAWSILKSKNYFKRLVTIHVCLNDLNLLLFSLKASSTWNGSYMYTVTFQSTCCFHMICLYSSGLFFWVLHVFNKYKELLISINVNDICYSSNLYWNANRLNTRELYLHWNIRQDVLQLFQINKVFWYVFSSHFHLNTLIKVLLFPSLVYF